MTEGSPRKVSPQPTPTAPRPRRPRTGFVGGLAAALLAAAPAALPTPARADPQADYASLFGADEKKVLATPSTKDDAAFATTLLSKSADLKDAPDLRRIVLARAVELGQKDADGLETAVEAAKLFIADAKGVEKLSWQSKLTDLYAAQYKRATGAKRNEAGAFLLNVLKEEADSLAGQGKYGESAKRLKEAQDIARTVRSPRADEFADASRDMLARQATADRLGRLKAKYQTSGGDQAALEQLVLGYLLELGDATAAATLAASHTDRQWERMVGLAAKRPADLSQDDLLALGEWLAKTAERHPPATAAPLLGRAHLAYRRFLVAYGKKDAVALRAQEALDRVSRQFAEAAPGAALAEQVVIWNSHNAGANDRGATTLNVALNYRGKTVWRRTGLAIDWAPNTDKHLSVDVPPVPFDAVRVEVTAWHGQGVGLAEVQVMAGSENLAAGQRVTANGAATPDFAAAFLTDGVTSSAQPVKGTWMAPSAQPAWAEVGVKVLGKR